MPAYGVHQSSTAYPLLFLMVQSSDHITGLTLAAPTVTISKAGAAFATPAGAVTELANGWYKVAGNATDTATLGPLLLHATAASGDPVDMIFEVVAYDPQDAAGLGLGALAAINSKAFNKVIEYIAGATCGTLSEPADRSTTTIKGINSGTTIITSANTNDGTAATRTVTLH